jgi:cytochrome P450
MESTSPIPEICVYPITWTKTLLEQPELPEAVVQEGRRSVTPGQMGRRAATAPQTLTAFPRIPVLEINQG